MIEYFVIMILLALFAIMYGKIIFIIAKTEFFSVLVRKVMNYCCLSKSEIENSLLGVIYYLYPLCIIVIMCLVFKYPVYAWLYINVNDMLYIVIAIIAFISVMSAISGVATIISPKTNWINVISSTSWIVSVNVRKKWLKFVALVLGACCEEFFFRGLCFGLVYYLFPENPIWIALLFSSFLFGVQQSLFSSQKLGKLLFMMASIGLGLVAGCFMLYTNSILPSLIAHEFFVVFYFKKFDFK